MMKLALGTVQFGIPYGINNPDGISSAAEIKDILELAFNRGVDLLDTAMAYGDAESKIAEYANPKFRIVTKFSKVKTKAELAVQLQASLANLKRKTVYGYLAHNANELIENPKVWEELMECKADNTVQKIGYSLYTTEQLHTLLNLKMIPDLVQVPYSLLDRKFESVFPLLKKLGTEIHVRSVFLQGLYYMKSENLPIKLKSLASPLDKLQQLCLDNETSIGEMALNFTVLNSNVDQVVIGINNKEQLDQNCSYIKTWNKGDDVFNKVRKIEVPSPELLNPANW